MPFLVILFIIKLGFTEEDKTTLLDLLIIRQAMEVLKGHVETQRQWNKSG